MPGLTFRDQPSLVVPCPLAAALAWADGLLDDVDLVMAFPRTPEAFLYASLPCRRAFRNGLRQMLCLWRRGAEVCILRTGTPAVAAHVLALGGRQTLTEPAQVGGKSRYILDAPALAAYLGRIAQNSAAWSGVTNSR